MKKNKWNKKGYLLEYMSKNKDGNGLTHYLFHFTKYSDFAEHLKDVLDNDNYFIRRVYKNHFGVKLW